MSNIRTSLLSVSLILSISFLSSCGGGSGASGNSEEGNELSVSLIGGAVQDDPLILSNNVTTFAGTAGSYGSSDGIGQNAQFNFPWEITTDATNLYITDRSTIRKIEISTGMVSTIAGNPNSTGSTDGIGLEARFSSPRGITTDGTNLYVVDSYYGLIRKIVISTGVVTTIAGNDEHSVSVDGIGEAARFYLPFGITTDGTHLYVTEPYSHIIRKITIDSGEVMTIAGTAFLPSSEDGNGTDALFDTPIGITTDGTNLYIVEKRTVRKIVISTGDVSTFVGHANVAGGPIDGTGDAALFGSSAGITTNGTHLYVTDFNRIVRKTAIATRIVTTLAGNTGVRGYADGNGPSAQFNNPVGITTDGDSLYIVDSSNSIIRKIN